MVEFLVKNGANVNTIDSVKRTPLHWSAYFGKFRGCFFPSGRFKRDVII